MLYIYSITSMSVYTYSLTHINIISYICICIYIAYMYAYVFCSLAKCRFTNLLGHFFQKSFWK